MRLKLSLCLFAFLLTHFPLTASNEISLKAAHSLFMESLKSADVNALEASVHPRALGFFNLSQRAVLLTARRNIGVLAPSIFSDFARFARTATQDDYRVVGDTGVVCSTLQLVPAGGKGKRESARVTLIYTLSEGRWRLFSWHSSNVPLKSN